MPAKPSLLEHAGNTTQEQAQSTKTKKRDSDTGTGTGIEQAAATPVETDDGRLPGFGAIMFTAGLLTAAYIIRKRG